MKNHDIYSNRENDTLTLTLLESGKSLDVKCSIEQYLEGLRAYKAGGLMQDAMKFLDANEREFLMSGLLPSEYAAMCAYAESKEEEYRDDEEQE